MAIGDNWNDLSMLEIAGVPVLMGNAPDDLRIRAQQEGWLLTLPHDADGVAEAIARALPKLEFGSAPLATGVGSGSN
jgi:hydroxymethylpyrimidine pyrophosphatase-like HAD family hydrolase